VVLLLVAAVLLLKNRTDDAPAAAGGAPASTAAASPAQAEVTATLPEAVGQAQATASLDQAAAAAVAEAVADESPEAQLDRLVTAGQPTLAFFHSDNCVQCIKMMDVVDQVYPEFRETVALVDVNVYDERNSRLLQRAGIRAIPTQIFFDSSRQGWVIMGAMTPEQFREQLQKLAGGQ